MKFIDKVRFVEATIMFYLACMCIGFFIAREAWIFVGICFVGAVITFIYKTFKEEK